jgi:putative ABC transport system permease protein
MRKLLSWMDVKLGLRMLVKHPGLSLIGGLGIAVTTAISTGSFAFFYSHLYPHVPLPDGDRLVALENWDVKRNNEERRSMYDVAIWQREMREVQEIGAFRSVSRTLIVPGRAAEDARTAEITPTGLQVARVPPLHGRLLGQQDVQPGAPAVVVIGHAVWESVFSGQSSAIGADIQLGDRVHTIVGVMPEGFGFPMNHEYWTPLAIATNARPRGGPALFVFGRLAPGATMESAQTELTAIGHRIRAASPATHADVKPQVLPYTYPLIDIQDVDGPGLFLAQVQIFMSLALVIVCVNVAVLVYARTAARHGEIAVRTALGASRTRVVGQLFVEALVLAAISSAAGLALAQFGMRLGNQIMYTESAGAPFWARDGVAPETLLYIAGLTALVAVLIGVIPALQVTGRGMHSSLRDLGGSSRARLGSTWTVLIVAQVAVTVAALPALTALAWSQVPDAASRPAFASQEFLAMATSAETQATGGTDDVRTVRFGAFYTELGRRLALEPEVAGVTLSDDLPGSESEVVLEVEKHPSASASGGHSVRISRVAPNFFETLDVPTVAGRTLRPDDATTNAVMVNEAFVARVLGGGAAVGTRIRLLAEAGIQPTGWWEITGVVRDLYVNSMDPGRMQPAVYRPTDPGSLAGAFVAMRIRGGDPERFTPRLREVAAGIDPAVRLARVGTFDSYREQEQLAVRLVAVMFGLVAGAVLLLSAAGIYAMMAFAVASRRREIGIRAALGADRRQVLAGIFGRALRQLATGAVAGLVLVALSDPLTGGEMLAGRGAVLLPAMALVMIATGLVAAYGPARRALRIQPTDALRQD